MLEVNLIKNGVNWRQHYRKPNLTHIKSILALILFPAGRIHIISSIPAALSQGPWVLQLVATTLAEIPCHHKFTLLVCAAWTISVGDVLGGGLARAGGAGVLGGSISEYVKGVNVG